MLVESGAILETLADTHGNGLLLPETTEQRAAYRLWMHFAEGSAMPPLFLSLLFKMIPRQPMPFLARPVARKLSDTIVRRIVQPQLKSTFSFVEAHLARHHWFAGGKFTAADIQMSFPCQAVVARGAEFYPHIAAFVARIEARPAYQAALERGGPFSILS